MNTKLEATKKYIRSEINSLGRYQLRAIVDDNMLNDLFIMNEDVDTRDVVLAMIESDTHWEINNYKTFIASMMMSKHLEYLTKYTPEMLSKYNVTTFKLEGYNIGFALKPVPETDDVEIVSVHNNSNVHNIGDSLVLAAVEHGGNILDHFDGFLSKFYGHLGFEEYGRMKWDDQYAPEDWNYSKNGRPDVILRRFKK